MQTFTFDLLTQPYPDDATGLSTEGDGVNRLPGATNYRLTVDSRVAPYFVVDSAGVAGDNYVVTMHRTGTHGGDLVRFAGLVVCDTDLEDPQDEPPTGSDWPALFQLPG